MPLHRFSDHELQLGHYWHLQKVRGTRVVEASGRALMRSVARLNAAAWLAFSRRVCRWGGKTGNRVYGQIRKNSGPVIESGFSAALVNLRRGPRNLLAAKHALKGIRGLGSFSYASKHLRMLAPEISPVLDEIVDNSLVANSARYAGTPIEGRFLGYADFCQAKALQLKSAKVKLGDLLKKAELGSLRTATSAKECAWTAGDVDMACFALIRGWALAGTSALGRSGTSKPKPHTPPPRSPKKRHAASPDAPTRAERQPIYLAQNHVNDTAVTLKGDCGPRRNLAWICRTHGSLDFKDQDAPHLTRYLIGEILAQGVDVTTDPHWVASHHGETCHHGGCGYQGGLRDMGTVAEAVRYLKRFFEVRACPENTTETQAWIDGL
jgi:hypothetical protein